jgi:hypothetical protein
LADSLEALVSTLADHARNDPNFARALGAALQELGGSSPLTNGERPRRKGGRRPPGPFDPFETYSEGVGALRARLETCDVDQLKDIVAEHGMDYDRLAMKWKTTERLIERIVETVETRVRKGEAFRPR